MSAHRRDRLLDLQKTLRDQDIDVSDLIRKMRRELKDDDWESERDKREREREEKIKENQENSQKKIFEMKLFDKLPIHYGNGDYDMVKRVPGGWIFNDTFVPFNQEGNEDNIQL